MTHMLSWATIRTPLTFNFILVLLVYKVQKISVFSFWNFKWSLSVFEVLKMSDINIYIYIVKKKKKHYHYVIHMPKKK